MQKKDRNHFSKILRFIAAIAIYILIVNIISSSVLSQQITIPNIDPNSPQCSLRAKGDANCDGTIDREDLTIFIQRVNGLTDSMLPDFNDDSRFDLIDFWIWRVNYDTESGLHHTPSPTPTPEPPSPTASPTPTSTIIPTDSPSPLPKPILLEGFFVAPDGTTDGEGTIEDPWDLETALERTGNPGETIWIRGGRYEGSYTAWLKGTADEPIIVQAYPGERAIIDAAGQSANRANITVKGQYTWFVGLELTNSTPKRTTDNEGSHPSDKNRGQALSTGSSEGEGVGVKFINMIIHDASQGISAWRHATNLEAYGNIIYNNGWQGPDRGHGHGIYSQNQDGTKIFTDNIIFQQFATGIKIYGSSTAPLKGYHIEGNTSFNNGLVGQEPMAAILLGGWSPVQDITLNDNITYFLEGVTKRSIWIDYGTIHTDLSMRRNHFIGGRPTMDIEDWEQIIAIDNTFYGRERVIDFKMADSLDFNQYNWENNTYYGQEENLIRYSGQNMNLAEWQDETGLDNNSQYGGNQPTQTVVQVRPNAYEEGRAHITVINWANDTRIQINAEGFLQPGDSYEVHHVYDLFGEPVTEGVYQSGSIEIPLDPVNPPEITGGWVYDPVPADSRFHVFLVRTKNE